MWKTTCSVTRCILLLSFLWGPIQAQDISSLPSKENFLRRAFHRSAVRGNFLYIDGGELNQIDLSTGKSVVSTQNTTLSVDLRSSWTNDTVVLNSILKDAPVLNMETLWRNPDGKSLYVWGGANSPIVARPRPDQTVWKFQADGSGGGSWSQHGQAPSSISRAAEALVVSNTGVGYAVGGTVGGSLVQGLVEYDMSSETWTNASTADLGTTGTAINGELLFSTVFGQSGILIALGGSNGSQGDTANLDNFGEVDIYDIESQQWLKQVTSGTPPLGRVTFCAIGVHSNSSYEIFLHGGYAAGNPVISFDDVYVLSLPSFSWYKADYSPGVGRTLHTCNPFQNQMIVVGGTSNDLSWYTGDDISGSYKDPWPWGLGVFDMSTMQWASEFNPDAPAYTTPVTVQTGLQENGNEPSSWTSSEIQAVFSHTILNINGNGTISSPPASQTSGASSSSSSSSSLSGGAIAGIAIGAAAIIAIIVFAVFWTRRRKNKASRATAQTGYQENNPNSYSMDYTKQYSPGNESHVPLVGQAELDGGRRPEKYQHLLDRQEPVEMPQGGFQHAVGGQQAHEKMGRDEDAYRHEMP